MMLHIKYLGSRPCGFRQEDFSCYPYISLCKPVTPGAGPFLAPGNNLNRGPLGDATYQISRLLALWFQTRRFLKFSS